MNPSSFEGSFARISVRLAGLSTAVLISACSGFAGAKLGADGKTGLKGIPYALVRPEYTLSRTAPADGQSRGVYTIGVTYEADPNQLYTINVDPSWFVVPSLTVGLGPNGTLKTTTSTFTEQVTPTINAIGSFTGSILGALATGAFDEQTVRQSVKDQLAKHAADVCVKTTDVAQIESIGDNPNASVKEAISARVDRYKNDDTFIAQIHYRSPLELACFKEVANDFNNQVQGYKPDIEKWKTDRDAYKQQYPDDQAFAEKLDAAVTSNDEKVIPAIVTELQSPGAQLAAQRIPLAGSAQAAVMPKQLQASVLTLKAVIEMDDATWRARNLVYVEQELDRLALWRLRNPDKADGSKVLAALEELNARRAGAIGVTDLFLRAQSLSKFLETIPTKDVEGGTAPAMPEYAVARAELDNIQTQIDTKRTRLLTDAKPPPAAKPSALNSTPLILVDPKAIEDSKKAEWSKSDLGKKAPEYVLVLKEIAP